MYVYICHKEHCGADLTICFLSSFLMPKYFNSTDAAFLFATTSFFSVFFSGLFAYFCCVHVSLYFNKPYIL